MKWPDDFDRRHRLTVALPEIVGAVAGIIIVVLAAFLLKTEGLTLLGTLGSLFLSFWALVLMAIGKGISEEWRENMRELNEE